MTSITGMLNYGTINAPNIDIWLMSNSPLYMLEDKSIHFYGRDDKLEEIKKATEERKDELDSFRRTIVLVGFGGMGKSNTAKAFAEKFHEDYDYIVWIDSQSEQSVEASFRELAARMEVEFKSLEDLSKIQAELTNTYKNGLFIFDNAERLETEDNQFGIENLLFKKSPKNKPIFLATSRNGSNHWGGLKSQTKIIHIDTLTDEEATRVLKNYLFIKDKEIPQSVETAISSLVQTLGGYPLVLHLVGSTILGKTEEISFDKTVSRINVYTEMLKDVPLRDISEESKYEAALELIINQTTKTIMKHENGEIAMELLNIMACLKLDELYLDLVNAIYCGATWEYKENGITDPNVTKGLHILSDYSIVKFHDKNRMSIYIFKFKCVRNACTSEKALDKVCNFFKLYDENDDWLASTVARERIYNEAIKRIKISKHGTIAVEILDIVRCLNQDKLNRDLICTIYNTTFNSEFKNPDSTDVIKLLEENTIVKLKDHNELTIRKLIHERAGKMWSSGEALKKLCSFFEYNKHQEFCTPHVAHVSRSLLNTDCFENKSYFQCLILWRLLFTLRDCSGNSQWVGFYQNNKEQQRNKEMETAINS